MNFKSNMKHMNIKIAYFSGTGCTAYAASILRQTAEKMGHEAALYKIGSAEEFDLKTDELLIICYVVHACNPPKPVINWLKNLHNAGNSAAVLSVSGGGEITPNLASRLPAVRILEKKGMNIIYEDMLIMPSNWVIAMSDNLASRLIEVLPLKAEKILSAIFSGIVRRTAPGPGNRLLSILCRLEHFGAEKVGRKMIISKDCTGCGICSIKCPVGNIKLNDGKPVFSTLCTLCLGCIYSCPEQALSLSMLKFFRIKEGFSITRLLTLPPPGENFDLNTETEKAVWKGVRKYLSDI